MNDIDIIWIKEMHRMAELRATLQKMAPIAGMMLKDGEIERLKIREIEENFRQVVKDIIERKINPSKDIKVEAPKVDEQIEEPK